jgi:hypothetical protein
LNTLFYTNFGIITCAFATVESDLRILISGIAFKGESVAAAAFLDKSQLAENITVLRKLSRQYWEEKEYFDEIVKQFDKIRSIRNLFIHGLWRPSSFGEENGKAHVTDLKTFYEENDDKRTWKHGETREFSISDFQEILDQINSIREKIQNLCEILEDEEITFGYFDTTKLKPIQIKLVLN